MCKTSSVPSDRSRLHPGAADRAVTIPRSNPRTLWKRTGLAYWLAIFTVLGACVEVVATSVLPFNLTLIAFSFVGAFLGSTPLILMPTIARLAFGSHAPIGQPQHPVGQLYLLAIAALSTALAAVGIFPHESRMGSAVSEAGIVAAILAGAFTAELRPAVIFWLRRKTRAPKPRSHSS